MLAILFQTVNDCPVLVAANREEFYDRPGTPPELWDGEVAIVAGRDPRAGGTWLGVNQFGLLVAVTNRAKRQPPPAPRSRGLLCRDLLACQTAFEAHERALDALTREPFAGCNLLMIDASRAYVVEAGDVLRSSPLTPGMHVVTNPGLNDEADPRATFALAELGRLRAYTIHDWLESLPPLCAQHGTPPTPAICLHSKDRGTVSTSIIALTDNRRSDRWLHAQGPPCRAPFQEFSHLMHHLAYLPKSVHPAR